VSALTELTAKHFAGPEYDSTGIECDLPIKGDRVWVRSKIRTGLWFLPLLEGNATVQIHWHYDGCSIEVEMDDGTRETIFPTMGDDILPIDSGPASVLDRAAAVYASSSPPSTHTSEGSPEPTSGAGESQ
jgi:hypothetical protein